MCKIVSYLPLYGFLAYYINWLFVIILNCVHVRIIRKTFLIKKFICYCLLIILYYLCIVVKAQILITTPYLESLQITKIL